MRSAGLAHLRGVLNQHRTLGQIFGATVATTALSVLTSVLLARNLGPEGRGALLAITFWPVLLAAIFSLSLNEATAVLVAREKDRGRKLGASAPVSTGLVLQLIVDFGATLLTIALVPFFLREQSMPLLPLAIVFAALFPPVTLIDQHFRAVLQGAGAFAKLNVLRLAQPVAYAVGLSGLAITHQFRIESVLAVMVMATGLSAVLGAIQVGVSVRNFQSDLARETLLSGTRFHLANMVLYAATEIDKLLVIHLLDERDIGLYAVAVAVCTLGGGMVVQSLAMPLVKDINEVTTPGQRRQIMKRYVRQAALLVILVNGLAGLTAVFWLPLIFGNAFSGAVPIAIVLFVMGSIKAIRQILDRAMRAAHVVSVGIKSEGIALAVSIPAGYLGFRHGGVIGFVAGLAAAQAISLFATAWCVRLEASFAIDASA